MKIKNIFITILLLAAAALAVIYYLQSHRSSIIPPEIDRQVSFVVFLPSSADYDVKIGSINFDSTEKVLGFEAVSKQDGSQLTFSEQAAPDTFTDIPQYYDKLVEAMGQYRQIDTYNGRVTLTKPAELNGKQTAVLNAKGTLMFVRPSRELSDDEWRKIFNNLEVLR